MMPVSSVCGRVTEAHRKESVDPGRVEVRFVCGCFWAEAVS